MIYGSVCSGIETATVAWHPLGWRPAFFSEIEQFPRAVLAARWPSVLGNSMCVNAMSWIGRRIELVEDIVNQGEYP